MGFGLGLFRVRYVGYPLHRNPIVFSPKDCERKFDMKVFQWLSMICFMAMFAAVGGVEQGSIGIVTGVIASVVLLSLSVLFGRLGGIFYHR